ncbi:MAG: hypothetical protein FJX40_13855 [Alphaproteobacteria bacterium]|nr:hypothetical protein [Alphaproteobacteria bacterium]MBM3641584.1 hypothetical protein [Alphaproteobacteria bacterium]
MLEIIHKYVRRFIKWLNTPSQEEIAVKDEKDAEWFADRQRRREKILRCRTIRALERKPYKGEYTAEPIDELEFIATLIKDLRSYGACPQENSEEHLKAIINAGFNPAAVSK